METNNHLEIGKADINRSLGEIYSEIMRRPDRIGLPRITYQEQFDVFEMLIEQSNFGISVRCNLNGRRSWQLDGIFFGRADPISMPMLIAAGAQGMSADKFFS